MPKWKADAREFTVSVLHSDVRGYSATIPKPVMAKLGNPEKVTFATRGKKVEVRAGVSRPGNTGGAKGPVAR